MSYRRRAVYRSGVGAGLSALFLDILKQAELRFYLKNPVDSMEKLRRLILWRMLGEEAGSAYVFLLNRRRRCVRIARLCRRNVRLTDSYIEYIVETVLTEGAVGFFVAHNHANEPLSPSPDDFRLTATLERIAAVVLRERCAFLGHYITDGFDMVKIETGARKDSDATLRFDADLT